jgi:hypothetical protein
VAVMGARVVHCLSCSDDVVVIEESCGGVRACLVRVRAGRVRVEDQEAEEELANARGA